MATANKYIEAVGRRKTATARVRLTPAAKTHYEINGKTLNDYFPLEAHRLAAREAFTKPGISETFHISAKLQGGGIAAQAVALRHAISRALIEHEASHRGTLKKLGFLTRDPRAKERRKFGLKKARKAKQWSKR